MNTTNETIGKIKESRSIDIAASNKINWTFLCSRACRCCARADNKTSTINASAEMDRVHLLGHLDYATLSY